MNLPNSFTKRGTIKIAILVALAALGHSRLSSSDAHQATGAMTLPGVLEKRDAYTCYGVCSRRSNHDASHAQYS